MYVDYKIRTTIELSNIGLYKYVHMYSPQEA
jgi:hypothetical protein